MALGDPIFLWVFHAWNEYDCIKICCGGTIMKSVAERVSYLRALGLNPAEQTKLASLPKILDKIITPMMIRKAFLINFSSLPLLSD